ncbi:DUF4139 domain-containing protein [Streptomyces sp. JH34]|uniref:DUF4139 domain-containing protein n=1 Tax=Streptomyces sp. JH34 TaxID=2793633 RepID=UPI0023F9F6EB|nr:DUF4139 domain-containing protein [Streptomyces sp. JH34]MDF6017076.1 DUF4139 domain-containing protein [Streptomyces sp. JH34]
MTIEEARRWASNLDSVVVYEQGAVCRRLARGAVPPDGRVRVTGLPRSLDPASLRARVPDARGVRVSEARVEVEAEPLDASAADGLRVEVERLRDEHAAARGRRDHQLNLIEEVRSLRPVVPPARRPEDALRRTPVDAWLELADFVDERLTRLHSRLVELEDALGGVEHELGVAVDKLARASTDAPSAHVETTVSALLTLDVSGAGSPDSEIELELEYGVPGAVWAPAYRLTYRQGDSSGRLVLRASVAQRTGEDWTDVALGLATADLRRGTGLPKLRSLRIGRSQPDPAPAGWREPPAGLSDLFAGYDTAPRRPAPTVRPVTPSATPPVPPPLSAPQAYGGPPASLAAPGGAGGAAPERFAGHVPAPAPTARARKAEPRSGGPAPAAPGAAPPPPALPSPPAGPPRPSGAELDYSALVLCGPDERDGRRGRLFPGSSADPVATEHRHRAESVAVLPLPGHAVRPRESAGSFDHRFDTAARTDIPSDGTWHTVTVGEIAVGMHTEYLCTPSVEQTVYAALTLSNSSGQALLAGPVEVTVDDDFLLTAALPTLAPGGVRRVGLGPVEGIQVTRRTHVRESTSGLRNSTTVLDHRVHVELANRLAGPVTVEVRERVPVSSEPDVRIEERADWSVPEDGSGPDRLAAGTRVWRVGLPAGGTSELDGGYEIRIPAGRTVVGGNRRS